MDDKFYSIGEVSKICNISKKALRFYDKIGIIAPEKVSDENNYRFYNRETLLSVPVIKYYKQMGFKLDEMNKLLEDNDYFVTARKFNSKIDELRSLECRIHNSFTSVKDWYELVLEAQSIIDLNAIEVSVKYIDEQIYCYMDQDFNYNYREAIINIEWTNYLEEIENEITGPVICVFPSYKDKTNKTCNKLRIMQRPILPYEEEQVVKLGGYMAATCYHIGKLEDISSAYERVIAWAEHHGYKCNDQCIERYVTDYWTTRDNNKFVTEVMIKVERA